MACNTINSSIGIFTLAILAVLIVAVALGDDTRRSRMAFAAVLTLHAVNTFGGLLAQRFTGLDDTFSIMMTYIGNYGTYMVGPVAVTGFILLACANLPTDLSPKARRTTTGLIVTPGVLNMLLIILNPWTGWVFRIGEGNAFVWGPLHMLPDDMAALQMLVSLLVVPLANAGGAKHVLLQWLALFMLPIAAGIVENRHDSLTLMYPAIAFSLMILFILRRQSNEERRILAEHELAESKAKLFTEQLHPHFIFNSLTAIQELCMEDSTRARKAVQELSVYLAATSMLSENPNWCPYARKSSMSRHTSAWCRPTPRTASKYPGTYAHWISVFRHSACSLWWSMPSNSIFHTRMIRHSSSRYGTMTWLTTSACMTMSNPNAPKKPTITRPAWIAWPNGWVSSAMVPSHTPVITERP